MGVKPVTYAVQSEHATAKPRLSHEGIWPGGNFRSFNLYGKGKNAKNKTNTDSNPTTNPNPKPTIDKAPEQKEMN